MKKVLAILFAVFLCISSLYTVAFAEEEMSNEMIPVCVSVPEGLRVFGVWMTTFV